MNFVDEQYLRILEEIKLFGTHKETRAGEVMSLFGCTMRIPIDENFPLLTSKRMYYKGIIHELLWFLKGDTNIRYLVEHDVHIWDDDAYRWYLSNPCDDGNKKTKEEFIKSVLRSEKSDGYCYGDLGAIYGKQWRNWDGHDQIADIIDKLKNNPDDRRMILSAWNVSELSSMALPPCHVYYQFYSRPMNASERLYYLQSHSENKYDEWVCATHEKLDELNVPKRKLSCMLVCRSQDFPLGTPYNIASASFLTYMIAQVTEHAPSSLVYMGGDCHYYINQTEGVNEQLKRRCDIPSPTLRFARDIKDIDDFKYEDFIIEHYNPQPTIKFPLSVGL